MSTECPICFLPLSTEVECNQCHQSICLECYSQLDKCPFCRRYYNTKEAIDNIFRGCERINQAIARLERLIQRLS